MIQRSASPTEKSALLRGVQKDIDWTTLELPYALKYCCVMHRLGLSPEAVIMCRTARWTQGGSVEFSLNTLSWLKTWPLIFILLPVNNE